MYPPGMGGRPNVEGPLFPRWIVAALCTVCMVGVTVA
jgi:hypothetical protein